MARLIVLISGAVGVGKSTLVRGLETRFDARLLKTRELIRGLASKKGHDIAIERRALQEFGEKLDRDTKGGWVRHALDRLVQTASENAIVVVDAVRIINQIKEIRRAYGFQVKHVHLTAPKDVLEARYTQRVQPNVKELPNYSEVGTNQTEARVTSLQQSADVVIDTSLCLPEDVLTRVCSHLGLYARDYDRLVDVIVGGQWGSEGKGHIASYLSPEYEMLVRVGGPNAGHKVFLDSAPYTHHQLPSGTLRSSGKLVIAPGSVLNASALLKEIAECKVDNQRLAIDPQAMIISPSDIKREHSLVQNIGSTGQGVGFATARRITDRGRGVRLARDVKELIPFIKETWEVLEQSHRLGQKVLIEGTQGAGLSLYHGDYPYVTSRDTSVAGALSEAGIPPSRVRKIIVACRSYPIRVQSPEEGANEKARRFEQLTSETITFIEEIERVAAAPVSLISTRFDFRSIIDRRAW